MLPRLMPCYTTLYRDKTKTDESLYYESSGQAFNIGDTVSRKPSSIHSFFLTLYPRHEENYFKDMVAVTAQVVVPEYTKIYPSDDGYLTKTITVIRVYSGSEELDFDSLAKVMEGFRVSTNLGKESLQLLSALASNEVLVREVMKDSRVDLSRLQNFFWCSICRGCEKTVEMLIDEHQVELTSYELSLALSHHQSKIAFHILEHPRMQLPVDYYVFDAALYANNVEMIQRLLEDGKCDPSVDLQECLLIAVKFGFIDIVRILIQDSRVSLSGKGNECLKYAVFRNDIELVSLLLSDELCDPSVIKYDVSPNGDLFITGDLGGYPINPIDSQIISNEIFTLLLVHSKVDIDKLPDNVRQYVQHILIPKSNGART